MALSLIHISRLSFFFNAHNDFFEEIAKYRAARKIWGQVMKAVSYTHLDVYKRQP